MTFVVDASAVVHALVVTGGERALQLIIGGEPVAPHLLDIEVLHGIRKRFARGLLTASRAREAVADFASLPIERYSHELLLHRIWELRKNITAYDASYVALAERLQAPLLTRDRALANSSGHTARIEYID